MWSFDADLLARELVRALRGRRSQTAMSRRLGFRSNVFYTWESGRRFPSASELFRLAHRAGADIPRALESIGVRGIAIDPRTPEGVAKLLETVRSDARVNDVAERTGASRFIASRWLRGMSEPRLPELLLLIEALTLRVAELVTVLVGPEAIPMVAKEWSRHDARRRIAFTHPWSEAILRVLETDEYRATPAPPPGFIAERIGVEPAVERACLEALVSAGLVRRHGKRYRTEPAAMDTSAATETERRGLKVHWAEIGRERLAAGNPGLFSWSVFAISHAGLEQLRAMHVRYMHALRQLVDESSPSEVVAVANVQLFELDERSRARPEPTAQRRAGAKRRRASARGGAASEHLL
jgi:hypothetical protein